MTKLFSSDKPTVDEILRLKRPNRRFVPILLNSTLYQAIQEKMKEQARANVKTSRSLSEKSSLAIQEELEELLDQADEASVVFVFQDIGKKRYDELERKCPPTEEQKKQWKDEGNEGRLAYNPDLFVPALVSECSVSLTDEEEEEWRGSGGRGALSPAISASQAEQIYEEWGEGDIEALFFGAIASCKERTSVPLSKRGIAPIPDSNLNSTTALNEESPTPIS